jgi:uncharacterized protein (TIGR03086 family)
MDEITLLEGIMTKTGDLIEGVDDDQWTLPTPCPDYDVDALVNHIVGWAQVFQAGSNGHQFEGDPTSYRRGDDPAGDFRRAATGVVAGWREHGVEREVFVSSGKSPGTMVFNMTLMEYLTHGWDLAKGTDQPIPFTDDEGDLVLARAENTLPDEYRGDAFGPQVEVGPDAPGVDRLIGFMGRRP